MPECSVKNLLNKLGILKALIQARSMSVDSN